MIRPSDRAEILAGTPQPKTEAQNRWESILAHFTAQIRDPSLPSWTFVSLFIICEFLGSFVHFYVFSV